MDLDIQKEFETVISPKRKWYDLQLRETYQYRDLIFLFVKRNFSATYKQTILGPAWYIINPLLTTFFSTLVFGNIAQLDSDGVPYFIFYLVGYCLWNYFAGCINSTSQTFVTNVSIMSKVYFPRLTVPISTVLFSGINMLVVFCMSVITEIVFAIQGYNIAPNWTLVFAPLYMIQTAALALGIGILVSALTTKYRDLTVLVGFGVSLWMYITPVVYSVSSIEGVLKTLILLNPIAPLIVNFRYAMLGTGQFEPVFWMISVIVTIFVDVIGILMFNKVERTFADTV